MTQEQKDLLLKDICCRIPYGVKAVLTRTNCHDSINKVSEQDIYSFRTGRPLEEDYGQHDYYRVIVTDIKPYLFPLSSMSEEQWNNAPRVNLTNFTFESLKCGCFTLASYTCENNLHYLLEFINWLYKNHFDVNGLIPMGLANDATNLNIY